jgi:hypothetical protein
MPAYVDFTYYSDTYHGDAVTLEEFAKFAQTASGRIDQLTFERAAPVMEELVDPDLTMQDKIKMATCSVIDELKKWTSIGEFGRIKQESVGQHSVTYMDDKTTYGQATRDAAKLYLGNTGLMYPGLDEWATYAD